MTQQRFSRGKRCSSKLGARPKFGAAGVHDRRNDRCLPWSQAFEWEFKRCAKRHAPGVIAFEGLLLLDGWVASDEELPSSTDTESNHCYASGGFP
jgi:hypothetical protein